jgi:phage-related protein
MSRINLVTNPSFKVDTTGWSATGSSTIARITTDAFYGTSCLQITKAASANSGVITASRIAVTAASSYAVSAYVKVPDNQETGTLRIDVKWYTAVSGGTLISTSSTNAIEIPTGSDFTRLEGVMIAPALAVAATISIIQPLAGAAGKKFLVDAVLLEAASYIGEYFDNVTQAYKNKQVNLGLTPLPIPHITGMKLQADIAIGDLILNTIDENGVVWVCTDIEGWWTHPEPEIRDIPRGWGDGSYDVRGRYQARQLTLNGVFLTPDPSLVQVSRDKLIKETDLVYVGAWIKVDEEPTKASYVRLSGRPNIKTVTARGRTEFSIGLRAPDPLKYEWYAEDELGYRFVTIQGANSGVAGSGAGTVTNTGNAYAPVVLQITGPLTGPATILNETTNESITIIETLTSGQVLEIDTRDHVVTLDGDSVGKRSLVDVLAEWTLLAPGDNYFSFVDDGDATSDASLAIYYRSAWLG